MESRRDAQTRRDIVVDAKWRRARGVAAGGPAHGGARSAQPRTGGDEPGERGDDVAGTGVDEWKHAGGVVGSWRVVVGGADERRHERITERSLSVRAGTQAERDRVEDRARVGRRAS